MKKLAAVAAAVVVMSLLSAGCEISDRSASAGRASSSSRAAGLSSGPPTSAASIPANQLTIADARQVSSTWLADSNQLQDDYSPTAATQLMTGEALESTVLNNGGSDVPTSEPNDQSFFVPVQAGYPRWFVATERFPGEVFSTYMMAVFVQTAAQQPWKAALLSISPGNNSYRLLGEIARDSQGYATAIPVADSAVAIAPAKLPAAWARLYNRGTTAANDSRLIQPNDIDYYRSVQNADVRNGPKHGFVESARQTAGNLPVYALALTGGGALVIFTTINTVHYRATRTTTITFNIVIGSGIPEPLWNFRRNFTVPAGTRLSQVTTTELLAIDPPRAKGHVGAFAISQVPTAFSPATKYDATHGK
jgi:hypothetical protein